MKKPNPARLVAFLLFAAFFSCSKNDVTPTPPNPPNPPVDLPDTLTAGWSKSKTGNQVLYDIFFKDMNTGYAVGPAIVYRTQNAGASWDSLPNFGGSNLAITPNGNVFLVNSNARIFNSSDGGKTFQTFTTASDRITDIFFTGNDTGYATGPTGDFLKTINGGKNWTKLSPIPVATVNVNPYSSLYFISERQGWLTVGSDVYKINPDGISWTKANLTGGNPDPLSNASVFAPSLSVVYLGFSSGEIYKSTDGGLNFSFIKTLTGHGYLDTHFISNNIGYACHDHRIYKTIDGGVTWQVDVALGNTEVVELHFTDVNHGWACGRDGSIFRYNL